MLYGQMMDVPLTVASILDYAEANHGEREIVSFSSQGLHRYTIADFAKRVHQLANALVKLGVKEGDRVATFAWNNYRHLELYYAIPIVGAILHTINIRLFPEQVAYVLNHAEDKLVLFDASLAPALEKAVAADSNNPPIKRTYISLGRATTTLTPLSDYEELIANEPTEFTTPVKDERQAAMLCYTSATTGDPKGVLYSHRSIVLHAWSCVLPDAMGLSSHDALLAIVPMFHACAWGKPFASFIVGAKIVLNGDVFDGPRLIDLMNSEGVTIGAAVPTVWMRVRDEIHQSGKKLTSLKRAIVGGSALTESLIKDLDALGVEPIQGYGMTETSPLVSICRKSLKASLAKATPKRKLAERLKQGRFVFGVNWRVLDADGKSVPHDGQSKGELQYRGAWITSGYYKNEAANQAAFTRDGWFRSGDICTIDEHGFLQLVDRQKDLVKSGGEWISSVDLENKIMGHPSVKEAAVVGVPHPKWVERPVAVVVLHPGSGEDEESLKAWVSKQVATWWVPDRIVFVDALPLTGVGKFLKRELRDRFKDLLTSNKLPEASPS
jgi:3-(methylthio)propionyl---CoA ligase